MKSLWEVVASPPQHEHAVRKLERLAKVEGLELESERVLVGQEKLQIWSFFVMHSASTWDALILELLSIARRVTPRWELVLAPEVVMGSVGRAIRGSIDLEITLPISGLRSVSWTIRADQNLGRATWLNGQPNHW